MKIANRLLSVIVALALLVFSVLVVIELVWKFGFGGRSEVLLPYPAATDYLSQQTWDARPVRTACVALLLAGLALVVLELRRRAPGLLTLASSGSAVTSGVDRRSVEKAAATAASDVEGIRSARATIGRRRIKLTADAGIRDDEGLRAAVTERMTTWLDDLTLAEAPPVTVTVRPRKAP